MKAYSVITLIIFAMLVGTPVWADDGIKVIVNGAYLESDTKPVIIDGRTLVPLRGIFEALNIIPNWDQETQCVTANGAGVNLSFRIGEKEARVNEKNVLLDVPGTIIKGRTMVPVRFIAETFNAKAEWNSSTKTVVIQSEQMDKKADLTNSVPYGNDGRKFVSMVYENGDKYEGEMKNGLKDGFGTYTFYDGSKYRLVFNNEGLNVYVGEFNKDRITGKGKLSLKDGAINEGEFIDGILNGEGSSYNEGLGYTVYGTFVDGWPVGKGKIVWDSGNIYTGDFTHGGSTGYGEMVFKNGDIYVGYFVGGRMQGQGTYTIKDGISVTGDWENGVCNGLEGARLYYAMKNRASLE